MKIYISLPKTGHDIGYCRERAASAKKRVEALGHNAVTPFDVCKNQKKPYNWYMGKDIEALLTCDAIYLLSGWSESNGCQLEWRCAEIYSKQIFKHITQIPNSNETKPQI